MPNVAELPWGLRTGHSFKGVIPELSPIDTVLSSAESKKGIRAAFRSFRDVQYALRKEAGHTIPDKLVEQFGFDCLAWQYVAPPTEENDPLDILLMGADPSLRGTRFPLHQAEGTVLIHRMHRNISHPGDSLMHYETRIGGVLEQRVVAACYQGAPNHSLTRVEVSVSEDEYPPPEPDSLEHQRYQAAVIPIPLNIGKHWDIVLATAIITEAMVQRTGTKLEHRKAIQARVSRRSDEASFSNPIGGYAFHPDITVMATAAEILIGQETPPHSWSISVPRELDYN